jgi:ATP-binding cassette subfamily F protein 3
MIQLRDLCLSFGTQKVFDHLSMNVNPDQRLGLVGRNGSGKSTLLKAIDKTQHLDEGSITVTGDMTVAYMPQEMVLASDKSILEETVSSYKEVGGLRQRAQVLEKEIAAGNNDALEEYAETSHRLSELNVDLAIAETKKMLLGLGFKIEQFDTPVASLSVGWQMRIVLAKLLLQKADFYLFDEPTNHLDIVAKDWFLEFLKYSDFGFMLVCHDKYFLDELCTTILELDRGLGTLYYGNYTFYEDEKEARLVALRSAYEQQKKEIEHKEKIIAKFKSGTRSQQAKSMQKQLDKIEVIELPDDPRAMKFRFKPTERSGRIVLEVNNLGFSFGDKKIFEHVTFAIERGEKVALVAPNGMGKTTLFNVICGKYKQQVGTVTLGHNVKHTIFEQDQTKVLDPKKTIMEEALDCCYSKSEAEIRGMLGAFLFGKEEIQKKTKSLSGGEKNRVSMVKVILQDANFMLLDEPTNHLDITSKEILMRALQQYDGTMLFVSHDQDFVNGLANRIIELTPEGIHSYVGNYEAFLAQKHGAKELGLSNYADAPEGIADGKERSQKPAQVDNSARLKREQQTYERKIEKLEADIEKIQFLFADLEYGTPEFDQAQEDLQKKQKELKDTEKAWEALQK